MRTTVTIRVRPIHNEADYEAALEEISMLMDAAPDSVEADRLDVLATLVEAYEAKRYPVELPDPIEAIRFRLEQQGLTARDLEPFIGSRARVSEILNRRRPLSLTMIRRLAEGLGISASVLIRPTGAPSARGEGRSTRGTRKRPTRGAKKATAKRGAAKGSAKRGYGKRDAAKASGAKGGKGGRGAARKNARREDPVAA